MNAAGSEFFRYMSAAEADAVGKPGEVGYLRGGRPGETHWTSERYDTASEAKAKLALPDMPEKRLRFRMSSWPSRMIKENSVVSAKHGEPGGGPEWMTEERVEVTVLDVDDLAG